MIDIIIINGVDFRLAGDVETELRAAGARVDLIKAVKENYWEDK